ncbi:MAG: hypothetical protein A3H97_21125 [Acidobacteria bacterium RIFCSPLOWO2_02_FULL_65_29]|nr:MAG: hypothetical protein A3H97_21125 [Acidobacteria bacterium RIFCSPLOWO2_02_FULL_65_29]
MRRAFLAALLILASSACRVEPPGEEDYVQRITIARAEKDAALQKQSEPVPADKKAELLPLEYYPIDPSYNVPAILKPPSDTETLQMGYSDGAIRDVRRLGTLEFTVKGQPFKLTAYREVASPDVNHVFVPFADLTSGVDTYAAGRYIDLRRTATGYYELDFNVAYTPSCYFSPLYSCPVTPKENRLPIEIQAGEKIKIKLEVKS